MQHPPDHPHLFRVHKFLWRLRTVSVFRLLERFKHRIVNPLWVASVLLSSVGCQSVAVPPSPTPAPTLTYAGWEPLTEGIERRVYRPSGGFLLIVTAYRIDPQQFDFVSHYRPNAPLLLTDWHANYPEALLLFNTNFFLIRQTTFTGWIGGGNGISLYGNPYRRRGGSFVVRGGQPAMFSHLVTDYTDQGYEPGHPSLPPCSSPTGSVPTSTRRPDRPTRRTVIGMDSAGNVLVLVTTFGGITLLDLAVWFAESDLALANALNLNGGGLYPIGTIH
jgi:hypothetical protein